ncbi:hypothetical protein [Abyssisolibacter fermentans]|uniref:hypothetical protein n=1 Tax=Abyssisolibacter fermentans TaxID=1766203 RepID=UPI000829F247|nr:hypothetical protein [Abyssisolibacter fermentans]
MQNYILEKTAKRLQEEDIIKILVNDTLEITEFNKKREANKVTIEFELNNNQVALVTNYKLLDNVDNVIDERDIYVPVDGITIIRQEIEVVGE